MNEPSKEVIRHHFIYKDGYLIWADGSFRHGETAGFLHKETSYICLQFNNRQYKVHRLIWIYHFGDIPEGYQIDHINRKRADNDIENLRLSTPSDNQVNKDNPSGIKGISYHKRDKKWQASIKVNNQRIHIGYFNNPEEAHKAFREAELIIRGYNSD